MASAKKVKAAPRVSVTPGDCFLSGIEWEYKKPAVDSIENERALLEAPRHGVFEVPFQSGLLINEHNMHPGLALGAIDGSLKAPGRIVFKGRHCCAVISFLFSGLPDAQRCRRNADRSPVAAGTGHPHRATKHTREAKQRPGASLPLTACPSIRILLIALQPQTAYALFGPSKGQLPAFLEPAISAAEDQRTTMVPFDITDFPTAMRACAHRLHQCLLTDAVPKLVKESIGIFLHPRNHGLCRSVERISFRRLQCPGGVQSRVYFL
jgi:hypothetical protein